MKRLELLNCLFSNAGSTDSTSQPKQGTAKKSFKPVSSESLAAAPETAESPLQQQRSQLAQPTPDKPAAPAVQTAVKRRVESQSHSLESDVKKQRQDSAEDSGKTTALNLGNLNDFGLALELTYISYIPPPPHVKVQARSLFTFFPF